MPTHVALLRGINVGRAKRVAMGDLRKIVEEMGYTNVKTLLNSGNVVFESKGKGKKNGPGAVALREAIAAGTGVSCEVIVISAEELDTIVSENPLGSVVTDPARFLVAFPSTAAELAKVAGLGERSWVPDQLAIGSRAAYLWCAGGILDSALLKEFGRLMGAAVTTRNWATVLKLQALCRG